jgi:protein-L-isoaspartate(D-aspartate) O-methyltransferase
VNPDADAARRMRLILELRQLGVTDARVLSAIERTERTRFAPPHLHTLAWDDVALPISDGQTMTKPSLIAQAILDLNVRGDDRVLEIGTGSGYQTAILSRLAAKVTSVERVKRLADDARDRLGAMALANVSVHWADGIDGWKEGAPFDRVIVNAGSVDFLPVVLDHMAPMGIMLAAVGEGELRLKRVHKDKDGGFKVDDLGVSRIAMMESGLA